MATASGRLGRIKYRRIALQKEAMGEKMQFHMIGHLQRSKSPPGFGQSLSDPFRG